MSHGTISQEWMRTYEDAFLKDVHQLLLWGYEDATSKITADSQEEEITGWIVDAINDRLDGNIDDRFQHYIVEDSPPVRHSQQTGKRRKKLDIVFNSTSVRPAPQLHCEAKRLRSPGFTIGDYVGSDGLGCFTNAQYAAEHHMGAMVGYIQSQGPDYWIGELQRRLDDDKEGVLRCLEGLSDCQVLQNLSNEKTSRHTRVGRDDILIYHIFLSDS